MEKRLEKPRRFAWAVALGLGLSSMARAETGVPEMHVVAMPLSAVVAWYSEQTGQIVVLPDGLAGRVVDVRLVARMDDFTAWMARDFGLEYYRIGKTLYFSAATETVQHMLPLGGVPLGDLIAGVEAVDAQTESALAPGNQEGTAVLIRGPAPYVALVETVLKDLQADRAQRVRIIVNRGGEVSVDDLGARRDMVSTRPKETLANPTSAETTAAGN